MFRYISFTDDVLAAVERDVASHPPERGGALLGPKGEPIVSVFLHDPAASTTSTTYTPARALQDRVQALEASSGNLELKGILHSHPGALNQPSIGDLQAFADSLRKTPWLGRFVTPIVTTGRATASHEVGIPSGRMSVFVVEMIGGRPAVEPAQVNVVPICAHVDALAAELGGRATVPGVISLDGLRRLAISVKFARGGELQIIIDAGYPFTAPLVLAVGARTAFPPEVAARLAIAGGSVQQLPIAWNTEANTDDRLMTALQTLAPAEQAPPRKPDVTAGLTARLGGFTTPALREKRVLVVGAGSGGSLTAELLVRSGVEKLTVVDNDAVAVENLSRSIYTANDIGQPKVEALKRHLEAINPGIDVDTRPVRLQEMADAAFAELVASCDLVVAATDDPQAQRQLNHFAYSKQVPAVFGAVYAKGRGGDVAFIVPGVTRCYACTVSTRHAESDAGDLNYGTGRLDGEPALGTDIHFIVAIAAKLALALLHLDEPPGPLRDYVMGALARGTNFVIASPSPNFSFFPTIFEGVPGQYAYQSAWLETSGDRNCVVCGDEPVNPVEQRLGRTPDLKAIAMRYTSS